MKKLIFGVMTLGAAFVGTIANGNAASATQNAQPAVSDRWPISFDTLTHRVSAVFPSPSREITQETRTNRLYLSQQMSEPDKNGIRLRETFTLVYQEQPLFSAVETNAKSSVLADRFLDSLRTRKGVTVTELDVSHKERPSKLDQHYRVLEVSEGAFTDYYVIRVIKTEDGAAVAVHTIQKDTRRPVDWASLHAWSFVDSLEFSGT